MRKLLLLLLTLIAFAPPISAIKRTAVILPKDENDIMKIGHFSNGNTGTLLTTGTSSAGVPYEMLPFAYVSGSANKLMHYATKDGIGRMENSKLAVDFDYSTASARQESQNYGAEYLCRMYATGAINIGAGVKFKVSLKTENAYITKVQLRMMQAKASNWTSAMHYQKNISVDGKNLEPLLQTGENRVNEELAMNEWMPEDGTRVSDVTFMTNISFYNSTAATTQTTIANAWAYRMTSILVEYEEIVKPSIPNISVANSEEVEDGISFFGETQVTFTKSNTEDDDNYDIYWLLTNDESVEDITPETDGVQVTKPGKPITISKGGRLIWMAAAAEDNTVRTQSTSVNLIQVPARPFDSIGELIGSGENDGVTVRLNCPLNIVGAYETNYQNSTGNPTYYAYVRDEAGKFIKVVSHGAKFPSSYFSVGMHTSWGHDGMYLKAGSIVGVLNYNQGLPELVVKNPSFDYTTYLKEATEDKPQTLWPTVNRMPVSEITKELFNHYVVLENVKWVGENSQIEDAAGNRFQLYPRLKVPVYDYSGAPTADLRDFGTELLGNPVAGHSYRICAFIGQLEGDLIILPVEPMREIPSAATLMAPNALNGNVNIISDELNIWVDPKDVIDGAYYQYKTYVSKPDETFLTNSIGIGENNALNLKIDELFGQNDEIKFSVTGYKNYAPCHGKNDDNVIGPETVLTLRRHQSTPVQSIAEYKEKYLGKEDDLPEMITGDAADFTATAYHKFADDSRAVIIETTPEWLYVRDLEPTAADGKFHSENYILIHNENGWSNPTVTAEGRELRQGDIISGFALIPAKTGRGNLVSESTGFARTVKFVGVHSPAEGEQFPIYDPIDVGYVDPGNPGYYTNVNPGEEDRMRLIELRNVQVTRAGTSTADYVYTMKLGDGTHTYTVATDIFEHRLQGWHTAYDDETRAEDANTFNLYGIMIKNGTGYALAMIDYDTKLGSVAAPAVFAEGGENPGDEVQPFVNKLTVGITTEPGTFVYYSLNGKNPLVNTDSETRKLYDGTPFEVPLAEGSDRVVVQAFAFKPGMKPSELVTRTFVKQSRELSLLLNFIGRAEKDVVYHFNGTVKVVDVVGNYLMVRGVAGHYMPIYSAAGWENLKRGDYLTDFLMLPQFAGEDDAAVLRGATVADGAEDMFEPVSGGSLPEIDVTTAAEVSDLTGNLRRKVMLTNALFVAATGERSGTWMIKGSGEGATALAVNTEHTGLDLSDVRDNVNYNVTGYIMATADGSDVEFWPVEKVMLATPAPVKADVKATATAASGNEYTATFYPMAEVTLTHEDPRATIYYMIGDDDTDGSTRWYEYYPGRPIVISESSRIHARAVNAQGRSSVETHVTLTRLEPAGAVQIKTVPDEKAGTTAFTLSADNLPEGAKIWFGVGSTDDMIEYDGGEVVLDATDIVYACIRGGAQSADGAMCHYLVIVPAKAQEPEKPTEPTDPSDPTDPTDPDDPAKPEQPGDRVSGRVKFELTDDGNGAVKVKISPEQTLTGEYEIWYTTNTGVTLPEGGTLYTGAFDMTESGLVMAVLVEKGKPAGQTCEVTVWVIPTPTAIDSVGADGTGSVRVDGDSIIAPEGSEVYDVTGRRVRPEGLRNGIYIVRTPDGNAVKVAIR